MTAGVNDSSASNHQFILSGACQGASTAQAKFGNASLDNTIANASSWAQSPASSDFQFAANQFTVEAWVYYVAHSTSAFEGLAACWNNISGQLGWWLGTGSTGNLEFHYSTTGSDNNIIGAAWTPSLSSWYHVAVDRDASNVVRVYANGAVIASATVASSFFAHSQVLSLGNQNSGGQQARAYFDEVRISNVSRFGGAFTPPSSPYTPDANTVLLIHFERGALGNIANMPREFRPLSQFTTASAPNAGPTVMGGGNLPAYNGRTVSGTVTVLGVATAGLIVRAYAKATGDMIGQATTASDGTYSIKCGANWADVTVIAYDPTTYQAIAFDRVVPA
jgi:hypothetical protein